MGLDVRRANKRSELITDVHLSGAVLQKNQCYDTHHTSSLRWCLLFFLGRPFGRFSITSLVLGFS